ncbi:MAG: tetratricopeptide repeat protein [Geobacteraceae bacterium]|nr:tetratricopeptide repeat protein [Geobacteraceae bacterium]NTW79407.1 tetratricopeptide repeat protein [Geobacteraceae bacterium]
MDARSNQLHKLFKEGSDLLQTGEAAEALLRFQDARKIAPSNATLNLYTGAALHDLGDYEGAIASYRLALESAPEVGEVHNNLGNSLMALGRFAEAADCFLRASEIMPTSPVPRAARASALQAMGNVDEAEADCRMAVAIDPFFAAAHWNLALNLLLQGQYAEGWREYEWRWQKPDFTSPVRYSDVPLWDGSPLNGRTILLHAEQGFGDAIQFVRYAPLVALRGGNVVLECHPQLVSLFQGAGGIQAVVPFGSPLPTFSFQVPLLSLPRIFETSLQNIPSDCPYLSVAEERRKRWSVLVSAYPLGLRVGLVWAGKNYPDPLRSSCLAELAPLASGSITFFSLQLGNGAEEAKTSPAGMKLVDLTDQIHDFADTAALIEQLDLVISIDTAVAHLAGALGKATWLLLPYAPDWRWLLERSDSPWYPTMQIFRQEKPGDWGGVIDLVSMHLINFRNK